MPQAAERSLERTRKFLGKCRAGRAASSPLTRGRLNAEERQTKLRLAHAINTIVEKRHLVQAEAAKILGVNQPKVSALIRYKLEGFSVERLMLFLTSLDRDVEIVIKKKGSVRKPARITEIAA